MTTPRSLAEQTVRTFLVRANKSTDVDNDSSLFADGLGLDSLETAELSSMLEDEVGSDPFSEGLVPETLGELLGFYSAEAQLQT